MEPYLLDGDFVVVSILPFLIVKPKAGDIVVIKRERCIIKRISKIKGEKIFVEGDNKKESTDSRSFGWIDRKNIIGKVIFKLSS